MIDNIIGHDPILSDTPIIARGDLSDASRYLARHKSPMGVGERIRDARKQRGMNQTDLAKALGLSSQSTISDLEKGNLQSWPKHARKLAQVLGKSREWFEEGLAEPDLPDADPLEDYVQVEVLPTHAGMGGGGTGDGDRRTTLLPRVLVQNLASDAADLLVIDCEGDSMYPIFLDGDRVVINRKKCSLAQPGIFALWDGDGYVLKNVERDRQAGRIKVFSENPKYSPHFYGEGDDTLQIMGRPVWFARRV